MDKKTNVLLIIADQMRFDTINALGFSDVITPNLDRLVKKGCSFTHAISSNPVCMPARHDLLLGLPSKYHGYLANSKQCIKDYGIPTLPRLFSENGYRTAAVGKMHFYPPMMHHGYNELHLMEEIPGKREDDEFAMSLKDAGCDEIQNIHGIRPLLYHEPQTSQVDLNLYETTWVKNRSIEWLKRNNRQPFFLNVGYIKPHPPWDIPEEYKDLYNGKEIRSAIEKSRLFPDNPLFDPIFGDCDSEEEKEKIRIAYYTSITMMDKSVGEILDYLEESNQIDDTLIIFTSDHGEMLQDKGYYSKELPYESSIRVPLIMSHKDYFKEGSINDDLVDLLDIFPTCLDVASIKYNEKSLSLYGSSLVDTTSGRDREFIYSATGFLGDKRWVMCQNHEYKYIYHYNGGTEELYNLIDDKNELINIVDTMEDSEILKTLRDNVFKYERDWGAPGAIVDNKLIKFEKRLFPSTMHGKYHNWSNLQFQKFTSLEGNERREQFNKELERALKNNSGKYNSPGLDWEDLFNECLDKFTNDCLEKY